MKQNIVFYSHNFDGLGHTQRITLIMKQLVQNFGDHFQVIFLHSGPLAHCFRHQDQIKTIMLPDYDITDYQLIDNARNTQVAEKRRHIFERIFSRRSTARVVIEHYPFGRHFLDSEFTELIALYRSYTPDGLVFCSIRDIIDPDSLALDRLELFDRVLIHGDKKIGDGYDWLPAKIQRKCVYTGYVIETSDDRSLETVAGEKYAVVSLGGGQDGFDFVLQSLQLLQGSDISKIYVSLGKQYNERNLATLSSIHDADRLVVQDYFTDFLSLKCSACVVCCMGGYNSLVENLFFQIPTIVFPRNDYEQRTRTDMFTALSDTLIDGRGLEQIPASFFQSYEQKNSRIILPQGAYFTASFLTHYQSHQYIKIRLTNVCNAACDMCGVIKRPNQYNDLKKLKFAIYDFYKLGGAVVNFTGGEPTVYQGFWDLLHLAKGLGCLTSVSSNGSTLGDDFFVKLYRGGVRLIDYMDISVDGLYEAQDTRRKYLGLFDRISDHISRLHEHGIELHINVTVRNDNITELEDICDYFAKRGVTSLSFGMIASDPLNDTSHLIPSSEQLFSLYHELKPRMLEQAGDMKLSFSPDYLEGDFDEFCAAIGRKNNFSKPAGEKCSFINEKNEIRINEGGDIAPCCILDDYVSEIGNIHHRSLMHIICSKGYEDFLARRFPYISPACLTCKIVTEHSESV